MSLEDLTTDQLLARARQLEAGANTLAALSANPETREGLQRLLKKANPKLSIPEIDAKDAVLGEVKTLSASLEKLQNQILERDVRDRIERQRADVKGRYKLSDEDLTEVEKLMIDKDNPIPTYDAAARVFRASRTSATPTPAQFNPPTFQMPESDVWGSGIGNPSKLNRIAIEEAYKAFGEISSGKVAGMGPAA